MDSTLQDISNGIKNTQIGVRMTKLWSYEVGAKKGDCSNVATLVLNVATLQKQSILMSRRCCTTSRHSGLVFSGLLAHFEPIMEGFKAQTVGIERRTIWNGFLDVFEEEQAPFGWKHLGLVLGEISRVRSWKMKNT